MGDASIKISDDIRDALNQRIDKDYEEYQDYKNRGWSTLPDNMDKLYEISRRIEEDSYDW